MSGELSLLVLNEQQWVPSGSSGGGGGICFSLRRKNSRRSVFGFQGDGLIRSKGVASTKLDLMSVSRSCHFIGILKEDGL